MSNPINVGKKSIDQLSPEEKGRLLASIGTRRQKRPLDPITVAEILSHTQSNKELARKLGITQKMVGNFKSLLSLPDTIKFYIRSREISIDKAVRLAALSDSTAQQFLAKAILAEPHTFTAPIISKIVTLKNRNPNMRIENCTREILKSRPIVENRYIFVTGIEKSLSETITRKAEKQGMSSADLLKGILKRNLPNDKNLLSVVAHNGIVLLTLTPEGWQSLREKSGSLGVPLDELIETLVKLTLDNDTTR